jgi:hypothetical protein
MFIILENRDKKLLLEGLAKYKKEGYNIVGGLNVTLISSTAGFNYSALLEKSPNATKQPNTKQ